MLNEIHAAWTNALATTSKIGEHKDKTGLVIWEKYTGTFRDIPFELMKRRLKPTDSRLFVEIFVPSTKKFVSNCGFESKAEMMSAVVMAFTVGDEHEKKLAVRRQKEFEKQRENISKERAEQLRAAGIPEDAIAFFTERMDKNLGNGYHAIKADDAFVSVLSAYPDGLLGVGMSDVDQSRHIDNLYAQMVFIWEKKNTGRHGISIDNRDAVYLYKRPVKEGVRLPGWLMEIKDLLRDVNEKVHNDNHVFMVIVEHLLYWYANITGVSIDARLVAANERKARARENKLRTSSNGAYSPFGSIAERTGGNVLDQLGDLSEGSDIPQEDSDLDFGQPTTPPPADKQDRYANKSRGKGRRNRDDYEDDDDGRHGRPGKFRK